jgi:hypothetical protein
MMVIFLWCEFTKRFYVSVVWQLTLFMIKVSN